MALDQIGTHQSALDKAVIILYQKSLGMANKNHGFMKKFKEGFLHIGTEKTGTTSIQAFGRINREVLKNHGFYYPASLGYENHTKIAAYCCDDEKMDEIRRFALFHSNQTLPEFRKSLKQQFEKDISHVETPSLIVSNEHCHSRLMNKAEKQRLKQFFVQYCENVKIVIYLRRQDKVACSWFSTKLKCGDTDFEHVLPQSNKPQYYFDYKTILQEYAEVFGKENIVVRLFEKDALYEADVVKDFLKTIGCTNEGFTYPPNKNESLQYIAQYFLSVFNKVNPTFIDGAPNTLRGNIVDLLEQHYSGKGKMPTRAQAQAFYEIYREGNAWVKQVFFPERKKLFDDNFSDYPETPAMQQVTPEELAKMFSLVWAEKQRQTEKQQIQFEQEKMAS